MTSQQLGLLDVDVVPLARPDWLESKAHRDAVDTEQTAAALVLPKSGTQRMTVLRALLAADGLTDDELAEATGLYRYSAAPRRRELLERGWVEDSGLRRLTPLGNPSAVWRVTRAGRFSAAMGVAD